jgi:hypothetical protein
MKYFAICLCFATPAFANLEVRFIEGAPKDTFEFTNKGACDLGPTEITVDMSETAAGLYFDTTSQGAGVEVFQPFELISGHVAGAVQVGDGDSKLTMRLNSLAKDESIAFTIDVDDTDHHGQRGQNQVSRSEISGTSVIVVQGDTKSVGVIDNTSRGRVRLSSCSS